MLYRELTENQKRRFRQVNKICPICEKKIGTNDELVLNCFLFRNRKKYEFYHNNCIQEVIKGGKKEKAI